MLQSMGSQRLGHGSMTGHQQQRSYLKMSTDLNLSLQNATLSKIASNFITKQRMIRPYWGAKKEPLQKNVSDVAIVRDCIINIGP